MCMGRSGQASMIRVRSGSVGGCKGGVSEDPPCSEVFVRQDLAASEPLIHKPRGEQRQLLYYSGKKKAHTVKTEVVNPRGQVEAVSDLVTGSTHDLTSLLGSGVLRGLAGGE